MKAVIFGSEGQVGRALRARLPAGFAALAFARSDVDIGSADAVSDILRETAPDVVVNAAAYTAVDRAETEEEEAFRINAAAPGHIAEICRDADIRLVHISTDYVFDGASERPYKPDDPTAPMSVYGRTKLAGEEKVVAALPSAIIVRTAWVYAAGGANFVSTMLRLMSERDEVGVVADQRGTPTHAPSLAAAIWKLVGACSHGLYHFTDTGQTSWYGFAEAIEKEARSLGLIDGCRVSAIATADYPTLARRPAFSHLDCEETYAITGRARHWREELRKMLIQQKALT